MPRLVALALLIAVAGLLAGAPSAPASERHPEAAADALYFGSVAMDIPAEMHRRLKPLTDYLSARLARPVQLRLSAHLTAAADALASGEVDLAYLTPVAYLRAREAGAAQPLVKTVTQGATHFRLLIAVRADSPYRTVRDLVARRFAFGDPAALLQRAVVVDAGIRLEEFAEYRFLGHYDNIARGIANGDFDAGILKDTTAYEWQKRGLRVLYRSPPLPPYLIAVRRALERKTIERLRAAFLALDATRPEEAAVIRALDPSYSGFAPVSDGEYDIVRRLIRPFRHQGD